MRVFSPPQNPVLRSVYLLWRRYVRHHVAVQSAALAFYLLFTVFPLLIFISALLGLLQLDIGAILHGLGEFLPREVLELAEMYLTYVKENSSPQLLLFGLFFSVYFPMRATNALMSAVRTAYHLGPPRGAVRYRLKTLLYTVLLMAAIALTLTLMTVGERLLTYAVRRFGLPLFAAELWARLRFPAAGLAAYFALFFLYALAQDHRQPWRAVWPGTLAALMGWMGLSWLYAAYVDRVAHYSALYGSIGTVIVLMVWPNMSAAVLIMGAEVNGVLLGFWKEGHS